VTELTKAKVQRAVKISNFMLEIIQQQASEMIANNVQNRTLNQYMVKIDRYNDQILRILQKDGRITNIDLADRVGLSPSACLRRVQELEKSGIISGYRAVLDYEVLGKGFSAYIAIGLADHTMPSQLAFEKAMQDADEVRECHNITGAIEYLVRIEVADIAAYKIFHADVLGALPQVNSITTYVVMDSPKNERG
jgi:DNA-binding Lrp family transcriptional regulator